MLRSYFMNGLLAISAIGVVLVGYNAFIAEREDGHSASDHIAEFLNLDVAQIEQPENGDSQVTVDEGAADETVKVDGGGSTDGDSMGGSETESMDSDEGSATENNADSSTGDSGAGATKPQDKAETIYTVKEGDTYGCISEKYYGSFEHWPDIINANPNTVGFGEYELHVGARIVLPAIPAGSLRPASTLCS
jgi:LysM repeat protein